MPQTPPTRYRERLWPSFAVWAGTVFVLVMIDVAVGAGLGITTGVVFSLLTALTAVTWLVSASPTLEVTDTEFRAGRAHLPLRFVDNIEVLDSANARLATGRDADARTFLVTRGWVTRAVRFTITDPDDPTPDWIVSTRRGPKLAQALEAARRDDSTQSAAG